MIYRWSTCLRTQKSTTNFMHGDQSTQVHSIHTTSRASTRTFLPNLFPFARKVKAKPTDKDPNATVLNEHGYFGSPIRHYCRLCEALNYNSRWRFTRFEVILHLNYVVPHLNLREEKTYNDLAFSWSKASSCRGGFWRRGKQQLRYNVYQCTNLSLEEIWWSRWFE